MICHGESFVQEAETFRYRAFETSLRHILQWQISRGTETFRELDVRI